MPPKRKGANDARGQKKKKAKKKDEPPKLFAVDFAGIRLMGKVFGHKATPVVLKPRKPHGPGTVSRYEADDRALQQLARASKHIDFPLDEAVRPAPTVVVQVQAQREAEDLKDRTWLADFSDPKSPDHLVGRAKEVKAAQSWLDKVRRNQQGTKPILLLFGPPGTGKSKLAHLLLAQNGFVFSETNASDDRSAKAVTSALVSILPSSEDFGKTSAGLVLDELDGVDTKSGLKAILDFFSTHKQVPFKGPVIATANEVYALGSKLKKTLAPIAELIEFKPMAWKDLQRLCSTACRLAGLGAIGDGLAQKLAARTRGDVRQIANSVQLLTLHRGGPSLSADEIDRLGTTDEMLDMFKVANCVLRSRAAPGRDLALLVSDSQYAQGVLRHVTSNLVHDFGCPSDVEKYATLEELTGSWSDEDLLLGKNFLGGELGLEIAATLLIGHSQRARDACPGIPQKWFQETWLGTQDMHDASWKTPVKLGQRLKSGLELDLMGFVPTDDLSDPTLVETDEGAVRSRLEALHQDILNKVAAHHTENSFWLSDLRSLLEGSPDALMRALVPQIDSLQWTQEELSNNLKRATTERQRWVAEERLKDTICEAMSALIAAIHAVFEVRVQEQTEITKAFEFNRYHASEYLDESECLAHGKKQFTLCDNTDYQNYPKPEAQKKLKDALDASRSFDDAANRRGLKQQALTNLRHEMIAERDAALLQKRVNEKPPENVGREQDAALLQRGVQEQEEGPPEHLFGEQDDGALDKFWASL